MMVRWVVVGCVVGDVATSKFRFVPVLLQQPSFTTLNDLLTLKNPGPIYKAVLGRCNPGRG